MWMIFMISLILLRSWTTSKIYIGTDIVSVKRIAKLLNENGTRFKNKIFTSHEIDYCDKKTNSSIHYSGRFAAKESIKKCLLSSKIISQIDLKQIEILSMDDGAPIVSKLNDINYKYIKVSISHENDYAIAFSILKR